MKQPFRKKLQQVQPLREVVEICATNFAFCARLADGGVNVWGEPLAGAEITQVSRTEMRLAKNDRGK